MIEIFKKTAATVALAFLLSLPASPVSAASASHRVETSSGSVIIQALRIDEWSRFRELEGRLTMTVDSNGVESWRGEAAFRAETEIDLERRLVRLEQPELIRLLPAGDEAMTKTLREAVSTGLGSVSLDTVLQALPPDFSIPEQARPPAQLNFSPPRIIVSDRPSRLMLIDGPPARVPIEPTALEFVVNTDWTVFHHQGEDRWYLLDQGHWLTNNFLSSGQWIETVELPDDFLTLQFSSDWPAVSEAMPPARSDSRPLPIEISYEPAELVTVDGAMQFESIGTGGLQYVTNTGSDLFRLGQRYYLLVAGRWFTTKDVGRKWYAVKAPPSPFADIPRDHPRGHVLASVPGTPQARLAQIEAAIPRTAVVRLDAGAGLEVPYVGEPSFVEIQGTALRRAENSPFQVIQNNNFYYLCHDGAWYSSTRPRGPWKVAREVPEAIYTIPATDPAFNVTFVRVESFDDSSGEAAYQSTSGYYSRYWSGSSMVYGTGWYYPAYYHRSAYWRYPYPYGYGYGAWGPYYYPRYHYSATFEVDRAEKDWRWDLDGSKRAVYDYGPRNYVGGGTYVMPGSDNFKAGGRQ